MLSDALAREPFLFRFLCHLFQRVKDKRLNLVTGAGISVEAKVPNWNDLLQRLAKSEKGLAADIKTHRLSGRNPEYLGQIIYHRRRAGLSPLIADELREPTINHKWAEAVHKALYKGVPENIDEIVSAHPYLAPLRDLALKLSLVINFNFDDLLAAAMARELSKDASGQALAVVWRPPLVERAKVTTVYHVNGLLPRVSLKKRSEQLIFTEDSFADAMARSPGVDAEYTFLRFVQNTMLIIGHSLNDSSLKNYLRRNRDKSPANHHYMIYWLKSPTALSDPIRKDIFEANIELYNVITIFLTSSEIAEFLKLLTFNEREFGEFIDGLRGGQRHCFRYYIVGPVAAGKSTLLEHLRCFDTCEEWTSIPPREMYLAFDKLSLAEKKNVDDFVYKELKEKNKRFKNMGVGFHFMDRAPLDLYAFTKTEEEKRAKTKEVKERVVGDDPFVRGEVIFVYAAADALVKRNLGRGRAPKDAGKAKYLEKQTNDLRAIYSPTLVYDTGLCGEAELARKVARHALMGDYTPIDLDKIMDRYA
jgi:hypothetical protein